MLKIQLVISLIINLKKCVGEKDGIQGFLLLMRGIMFPRSQIDDVLNS